MSEPSDPLQPVEGSRESNEEGNEGSAEGENEGSTTGSSRRQQRDGRKVDWYKKLLNILPAIGDDEDADSETNEAALRFGAQQIIMLIVPVTICMAFVVLVELSVSVYSTSSITESDTFFYTPFSEESSSNAGIILAAALGNVAIVLIMVVLMTILLVCLFKHRCYRVIQVWLMVASVMLLFIFASILFIEVLQVYHRPIDWFSFSLYIWNLAMMGVVVIHWKGPLRLQQAYLILTSALAAYVFLEHLPNWTTWLLLFAISIWDLVAVLCPKGPLRILVETAHERNETIFPALIYSSTMIWPVIGMADKGDSKAKKPQQETTGSTNEGGSSAEEQLDDDTEGARSLAAMQSSIPPDEQRRLDAEGRSRQRGGQQEIGTVGGSNEQRNRPSEEEEDEEPRGFKLGLGDFVFYSVLVGRAAHDSSGDWVVISSCFVAILIGLCMTTLILGMVRRALPALPISIIFGLTFYFSSRYLIAPFATVLATTQTFI